MNRLALKYSRFNDLLCNLAMWKGWEETARISAPGEVQQHALDEVFPEAPGGGGMTYPPAGELVLVTVADAPHHHQHVSIAEWSPFFRTWLTPEALRPFQGEIIGWEPLTVTA